MTQLDPHERSKSGEGYSLATYLLYYFMKECLFYG